MKMENKLPQNLLPLSFQLVTVCYHINIASNEGQSDCAISVGLAVLNGKTCMKTTPCLRLLYGNYLKSLGLGSCTNQHTSVLIG